MTLNRVCAHCGYGYGLGAAHFCQIPAPPVEIDWQQRATAQQAIAEARGRALEAINVIVGRRLCEPADDLDTGALVKVATLCGEVIGQTAPDALDKLLADERERCAKMIVRAAVEWERLATRLQLDRDISNANAARMRASECYDLAAAIRRGEGA